MQEQLVDKDAYRSRINANASFERPISATLKRGDYHGRQKFSLRREPSKSSLELEPNDGGQMFRGIPVPAAHFGQAMVVGICRFVVAARACATLQPSRKSAK